MPPRPANVSLIHRRCSGRSAAQDREDNPPTERHPLTFRSMSEPEGVERLRARVDDDALRLQVELERLEPELAAEARLLVPAERDPRERRVRHVDADGAGLDP